MIWLGTPWGFGIVAVVAIAILLIVWRVGNIQLSKQGLIIGSAKKRISPHSACPHSRDIMEVVHRTIEYSERRQELKNSLIEEQMRFYEETEEEILGYMKKIFLHLLSEKDMQDNAYVQHPEYSAYSVTLKAVASDIKPYIRNCFKANHYASLSPEEQRLYVEKKKTLVIQKVTEALNVFWRGSVITRNDLYIEHKNKMQEFEDYIEIIFNRAFMLARETAEELDKNEKEYKKYIDGVLGS